MGKICAPRRSFRALGGVLGSDLESPDYDQRRVKCLMNCLPVSQY